MNLIQTLNKEQADRLSAGKTIPDFEPGDTVIVNVKVIEGERTRIQAYEGVCIGSLRPRHQRELHGPQDFLRRGRRACVPAAVADGRLDQARAPRQGAPGQALLPAQSARQVGAHRRGTHHSGQTTDVADAPSKAFAFDMREKAGLSGLFHCGHAVRATWPPFPARQEHLKELQSRTGNGSSTWHSHAPSTTRSGRPSGRRTAGRHVPHLHRPAYRP